MSNPQQHGRQPVGEPGQSLTVEAGRIVCPKNGLDGPGRIVLQDGRILSVTTGSDSATEPSPPGRVLRFPEGIVLPGLIDLHAHPDGRSPESGGSKYGLDPDQWLLARGTTTVLSQGDAGAANWPEYKRGVIEQCRTRILLALNLASPGETTTNGCFADEVRASVSTCVETLASGDPALWGIACNVSEIACEQTDPRLILRRGLEAAEQTGKPLLFGVHQPEHWSWEDQLSLLRSGDVMTYLYRDEAWSILEPQSASVSGGNSSTPQIRPAVRAARERGVLFDVGHGCGSFVFPVARAAIRAGFPPDTISTDGQLRHVGWDPVHDLPRVMSKLLAAGMPAADVFAAVTSQPARVLGLEGEVGELTPGACGDLTVLEWQDEAPPLTDIRGNAIPGGCWSAVHVIREGQSVAEHGQLVGP